MHADFKRGEKIHKCRRLIIKTICIFCNIWLLSVFLSGRTASHMILLQVEASTSFGVSKLLQKQGTAIKLTVRYCPLYPKSPFFECVFVWQDFALCISLLDCLINYFSL
jgi:hypothetical protein